jgi:hypothetical protein
VRPGFSVRKGTLAHRGFVGPGDHLSSCDSRSPAARLSDQRRILLLPISCTSQIASSVNDYRPSRS